MKENKEEPRKVSTCFEGSPCAELMEKIMGEGGIGIGSLCEEMMRSMAERYGGGRQEPREDKRQAREEETDPGSRAAQGRNKEEGSGGVK